MFSYYGSKSKVVDYYPPPKYDKIIEPFAGSARYALKYFDRDVLLVDKYPVIVKIWQWLQQCSKQDILGLPDLKPGQSLNDFEFDNIEAKWLMGFMVQQGVNAPRLSVSKVGNYGQCVERDKKRIAKNLFKIKHWNIIQDNYVNLINQEATWFIDPPYQFGGEYYIMRNEFIDFEELAGWCKKRMGQTIVCENSKADWLPFSPLRKMSGQKHTTMEVIWTNLPSSYKAKQQSLF